MQIFDNEGVVALLVCILLEVAAFAWVRAANAPRQLIFAYFMDFPADIQIRILELLDFDTVCHVYAAYSGHPSFEVFRRGTASHFRRLMMNVTLEYVVKGDHTKIDLKTLSFLPPCHAHIKTSVGMWELTKKWILVMEFRLLEITVDNEHPAHEVFDLKGLEVKPFAINFEGIRDLDSANIPDSVAELQITECTLKGGILDIGALAALLIILIVDSTEVNHFPCASLLLNLQHYTGNYVAGLPWSQLKTVVVDRIPDGTRCDLLEEATFTQPFNSTFENHNYPRLTSVLLVPEQTGDITELFSPDQLIRLKKFKGENVVLNDLTLLPNVEILHVKYYQTLTRHTPLSPHLVELKIVSDSPVEGISDQLTVFEYVNRSRGRDVIVDSTTLKRLLVEGAFRLTVECPHLEDLALEHVLCDVVLNTPTVRKLSLGGSYLPLLNLPNLRQLHIMQQVHGVTHVVFNHHLESVTLQGMLLGKVSFSADKVSLKFCEFTQTPSIDAISLETYRLLQSGDGVSCRELVCKAIERIPRMVEKLSIVGGNHIAADSLIGCDNLKALSVESFDHQYGQARLDIPESVEKLCLYFGNEMKVNVRAQQLKWYQLCGTYHEYIATGMLADLAVPVGPYLVCKPEMLPPEQPPHRQ